MINLNELIAEALNDYQKGIIDSYTGGPVGEDNPNYFKEIIPIDYSSGSEHKKLEFPAHIAQHLNDAGYRTDDYSSGVVHDKYDRPVKINKALTASKAPQSYIDEVNNDPGRLAAMTKSKQHQIVISNHPYDVGGMSTDRGWTSCMSLPNKDDPYNKGGAMREHLADDIAQNTHVAYLTKVGDDDIKNPIARIAIKKFNGGRHRDIYRPEEHIYGEAPDKFHEAVSDWANKRYPMHPNSTVYTRAEGLYNDDGEHEIYNTDISYDKFKNIMPRTQLDMIYSLKPNKKSHSEFAERLVDNNHDFKQYFTSHDHSLEKVYTALPEHRQLRILKHADSDSPEYTATTHVLDTHNSDVPSERKGRAFDAIIANPPKLAYKLGGIMDNVIIRSPELFTADRVNKLTEINLGLSRTQVAGHSNLFSLALGNRPDTNNEHHEIMTRDLNNISSHVKQHIASNTNNQDAIERLSNINADTDDNADIISRLVKNNNTPTATVRKLLRAHAANHHINLNAARSLDEKGHKFTDSEYKSLNYNTRYCISREVKTKHNMDMIMNDSRNLMSGAWAAAMLLHPNSDWKSDNYEKVKAYVPKNEDEQKEHSQLLNLASEKINQYKRIEADVPNWAISKQVFHD